MGTRGASASHYFLVLESMIPQITISDTRENVIINIVVMIKNFNVSGTNIQQKSIQNTFHALQHIFISRSNPGKGMRSVFRASIL